MIHRLLVVLAVVTLTAGIASATDIDRHGTFTGAGASAAAQCKNFVGTDDNRSACTDWCSSYIAGNTGASCSCDEGACPEAEAEPAAPMAAAAPATAH
jgi:hypothetical protein